MRLSSWLRSARCLFAPCGAEKGRPARPRKRTLAALLSVERLEDRTVPSTFTVYNLADSGAQSLRQAILDANANPGADVIAFAPAARDGTITLTGGQLSITDDLTINGPGASRLAVSGNGASRVFQIDSGAAVSIDGLTVTHGRGLLRGGGILSAGNLTLSHAILSDNQVVGLPGATPDVDALGGGILNMGTLTVHHTTFVHNQAIGADGNPGGTGSTGLGGAIMSIASATAPSTASVSNCTFLDNQAIGGAAGVGASFTRAGLGGAIMNTGGAFTISHCVFQDNQAVGGFGGGFAGGFGAGGAIANTARLRDAILSVSYSTLTNNRAVGGAAGGGTTAQIGKGGGIANFVSPGALPGVTATALVTHSLLLGNQAVGGDGPTGGTGQGGGITNEGGALLTVTQTALVGNQAIGGAGSSGNGGNGLGGGVFNGGPSPVGTPSLTLRGSFVVLNQADGGAGGSGGGAGLGQGGGLYLTPGGVAFADLLTVILGNDASTSDDDVFGVLSFI